MKKKKRNGYIIRGIPKLKDEVDPRKYENMNKHSVNLEASKNEPSRRIQSRTEVREQVKGVLTGVHAVCCET